MEALGLDGDTLRARFPRLIYGNISGLGRHGPLKDKPGFDAIVQAVAGVFAVDGDPAGQTSHTGKEPRRDRAGSPSIATYQCFPTRDGEILIAAANDRLFQKLAVCIGKSEWVSDPSLRTNADRIKRNDMLTEEIGLLLLTRVSHEWEELLGQVGFPVASINTLGQMLKHAQTEATGMHQAIPGTECVLTRLPVSFNDQRPLLQSLAPEIGAHNAEFLPASLQAGGVK